MPMTTARYLRIKQQLALWSRGNLADFEAFDAPVLVDMLKEMRAVLHELVDAQDETPPGLFGRIRGWFRG